MALPPDQLRAAFDKGAMEYAQQCPPATAGECLEFERMKHLAGLREVATQAAKEADAAARASYRKAVEERAEADKLRERLYHLERLRESTQERLVALRAQLEELTGIAGGL